jgi:ribose-phosphate pyrophosphokinase
MIEVEQRRLLLLSGRAHPKLSKEIARCLDMQLGSVELGNFANGEISCKFSESVRGCDVFIIQPHCGQVNDAIIEQALMIDTAKRSSAKSITAVCPFLGYARQDRKSSGREPVAAKLIVDILAKAGADRIMTLDLHSGQTQGFFDGPFDHLIARPTILKYVEENFKNKLVIVSPDAGRVKMAERYSTLLNCGMAIIHKQRSTIKHNSVEAKYLIGDVKGKNCVIVDDMIDTAGTICAAADLLKENGADKIYGLATHGLFSGKALKTIDSLPQKRNTKNDKIAVVSIAPLIADAIAAVFTGSSVSAIFDGQNQA